LDSKTESEAILFDVGRYEVRNMIMAVKGAVAPVVYGGKQRAILAYLDRAKLQARDLSPLDVMKALDNYNVFLPTGDAKFGDMDYAIDSNSMYELVDRMGDIPIRTEHGNATFLKDVAVAKDANYVQTNVVRVNGRRQVYVPVYRQLGTSTLNVVDGLKTEVPEMQPKLSRPGIDLKVVMDQSIYVRKSIESLIEEGILGAVLCSLVILVFLGEWRMTLIAVLTIPISVLAACIGLYYTGNTINVMTLAGLSLAIGPLIDIAIICLENTHRHLGLGKHPAKAAFLGASEVALPALVACCCTLLVLAPLAFMPGMGEFLFRPMALAVAFSMVAAYFLAQTFVPSRCATWLRPHAVEHEISGVTAKGDDYQHREAHEFGRAKGPLGRLFRRWETVINSVIQGYLTLLRLVMRRRVLTVSSAIVLLFAVVGLLGTQLRREFFPEVDGGAFEMYVRGPTGMRIEITEEKIARIENAIRDQIKGDIQMIISEMGVNPDWSAAYSPNSGPMDAVIKVQLEADRKHSAQEHVALLRKRLLEVPEFSTLEFAFDAGGMIRGAMNEGKSTPINIRISAKNLALAHKIAEKMKPAIAAIDGIVDCRILQRLDYPEYIIDVDRTKAADLGLDQTDVMKNVVAAINSSIQFNKNNFWIDSVSKNKYYVGVQYPEGDIKSIETLLDVPVTSRVQDRPIPLRNIVTLRRAVVPAEVLHTNLQATIDLTMGVSGRDLGHVADEVAKLVNAFGKPLGRGTWAPYDPTSPDKKVISGSKIELAGEYSRMQDTFSNLGIGLILASLLIYFLLVSLFKSYVTPIVVLAAVPIGIVGVVTMLYVTNTAINVQSLLGVIFMVGIVVSNTVLLIDFAQKLRADEHLSSTEAIQRAASVRVRPVVMTALAAFFALIPMALGLARGSEANTPLGRAVVGGLIAGLVTTLFVVPALYSLLIRDPKTAVGVSNATLEELLA
jgi:multidrug efflux pump subunit AcrB